MLYPLSYEGGTWERSPAWPGHLNQIAVASPVTAP